MSTAQPTPIWQRLQVAMIGLIIVFSAIFGANALINQASDEPDLADVNLQQDIAETGGEDILDETPSEPLVELGVTPVPKDDGNTQPANVAEPGANPVTEDEVELPLDSNGQNDEE